MAVSLELRSPFLDHRVVELGLALPPELAVRQGRAASRRSRPTCRPRSRRAARRASASRSTAGSARSCARPPRTSCSAARTAASSGAPELERLLARARRRRAPTTGTAYGASACSSSGSGTTSTRPGRRSPPREAGLRLRARRRGLRAAAGDRARPRARRDPRVVRREVRHPRARLHQDRHVRLRAGHAVGLDAAALRLVPDPDLLDRRAATGGRSAPRRSPSPSRPRCSSTRSAAASSRRAPG